MKFIPKVEYLEKRDVPSGLVLHYHGGNGNGGNGGNKDIGIAITADSSGNTWTISSKGVLEERTTAGITIDYNLPTGSGNPIDLTVGPDGAIWIAANTPTNPSNGQIIKFDVNTTQFINYPLQFGSTTATGQAITSDGGYLWIATSNDNLAKIDISGNVIMYHIPGAFGPTDISVGGDGNLYITDGSGYVFEYSTSPALLRTFMPPATTFSASVVAGADGNTYVVYPGDIDTNRSATLFQLTPTGGITAFSFGNTTTNTAAITQFNGTLYVADSTGFIWSINPTTSQITSMPLKRINPTDIVAANGFLWVTDTQGTLLQLTPF